MYMFNILLDFFSNLKTLIIVLWASFPRLKVPGVSGVVYVEG